MSPENGSYLLCLAACEVRDALFDRRGHAPDYAWQDADRRGAFVTFHVAGRLRGCIGTFFPTAPLPETIRDLTCSTLRDPRFAGEPLRADELSKLQIEVSVLSPLVRTDDPLSLQLGVHGVYVRHGDHAGCFLPQVAVEAGWDVETLLNKCCESKAHTSATAWRDEDAEVYLFTSEQFEANYDEALRMKLNSPRA